MDKRSMASFLFLVLLSSTDTSQHVTKIVIIGTTGSGKSSLANDLLGESPLCQNCTSQVSLSDEENDSSGRKALSCVNPEGYVGQTVKKDCKNLLCVKVRKTASWQETFDSSSCCSFQRFGFQIGENISTTLADGSPVILMCQRKYDGSADIVIKLDEGINGWINKTVTELVDEKIEQQNSKWNKIIHQNIAMLRTENNKTDTSLMSNLSSLETDLTDLVEGKIEEAKSQQNSNMNKTLHHNNAILVAKLNQDYTILNSSLSSLKTDLTDLVEGNIEEAKNQQNLNWNKTINNNNAILIAKINQVDTILTSSLSTLKTDLAQYNQNLQNLPGKWSSGSYCILASGSCPTGFTRHSGHVRAITTYAATPMYIKQENFGDSKITCHGTCGQYKNYYADIFIVTCCK